MCRSLSPAILVTCLAGLTCGGAEDNGRDEAGVPFTVSRETTHITQPRTPDGLIDYATALNERAKAGITSETNAAVLFYQAFGPRPDVGEPDAQFFRWMGMAKPEEEGHYFFTYDQYLQKVVGISEDDSRYSEYLEERKKAMERPWKADEYPNVAGWLEANSEPLALIVEGTRRPKYFSPIVSSRWDPDLSPALVNALLPELSSSRSAARALVARALLLAGAGKTEQAWNDLQATLRLGVLVGKGPTVFHGFVGIAVETTAIRAIPPLIDHVRPDVGLTQRWRRDVDSLPPPPDMSRKVAVTDRYEFLDTAQRLAVGMMTIDELKADDDQHVAWQVLEGLQREAVKWDVVMRIGNQWYDRMVEVMAIKDPQKRHAAMQELEKDLRTTEKGIVRRFSQDSATRHRDASESMGHMLASVFLPVPAAQAAEDRIVQLRRNLRLALALAAYHADEGDYPERLDALAPCYLREVHNDIFGGEPLRYRRTDGGYLLYSIGNNVRDDGGRPYDGKSTAHDLVVRMPSTMSAQDPEAKPAFDERVERKRIREFFSAFNEELGEDAPDLDAFIDTTTMTNKYLASVGAKPNMLQRLRLHYRMAKDVKERLAAELCPLKARFQIKTVKLTDGGKNAEVIARLLDDQGISTHWRLWLTRIPSIGWRINDWEDLALGLRVTTLIVTLAAETAGQDIRDLTRAVAWLEKARNSLAEEDFEAAAESLQRLEGRSLPKSLEGFRWLLVGSVRLEAEDTNGALEAFAKAESYQEDMPFLGYMRALAYNLLGRHEQALTSARRFLECVGDDADAYLEVGDALKGLGRTEEALAAYRDGLKDMPDSLGNLVALGLLLPKEKKGEIGSWFAKLSRPVRDFEPVAEEYMLAEDPDALDELVAAFRRVAPDDPNVLYYGAVSKKLRGEYAAAARMLPPAFDRVEDEDERQFYIELFLDCCLDAGKPLEGYAGAPDKAAAFEYLAEALLGDDRYDEAEALIEHHAKKAPKDPLVHYYRGDLFYYQDDWAKADQAYARGMKLPMDEDLRDDFRYSRVLCWYLQGKGLEAYDKLAPQDQTFEELVDMYVGDEKADELETLIAKHEARVGQTPATIGPRIMAAWLRENYGKAVKWFTEHREALQEAEGDDAYEDVLIRSLLRLGRFKKALEYARASTERDDDPYYEAVVHAVSGEPDACRKAVESCLELGYESSDLMADPDMGQALKGEAFAELRRSLAGSQSFVLLLKHAQALTEEHARAAAKRAWKIDIGASDDCLLAMSDGQSLIGIHGYIFMVHGRDEPYCSDPEESAQKIREGRLQKAFGEHRAWIAIDLLAKPEDGADLAAYRYMGKLLCELAQDDNALLVIASETDQLSLYNDELKRALRGAEPLEAISQCHWSPDVMVPDGAEMEAAVAEAKRRWPEFVAAFGKRDAAQKFLIKAEFVDGDQAEFMWVDVVRIERDRIHGVLLNDPVWVENIKTGDKTSFSADAVNDWFFLDHDGKPQGLFTGKAMDQAERHPR